MATEDTTAPRTSRVGKLPVAVPKGVSATINGATVEVKGPKGTLKRTFNNTVSVVQEGDQLAVHCNAPGRAAPRLQGLSRALLSNMVVGVSQGYKRSLELHGTGYRAELKGTTVQLALGFSHPIQYQLPANVKCEVPKDKKGSLVILEGPDKESIGQAAATIRSFRPPEPYSGKGVRYAGERIREKAGKAGSK